MDKTPGRWRDFWQLHLPLVFALTLCTVITIIEARRATEGVWRAWAYMFEWPMIGAFCIWIWYRYRTEGSVTRGLAARWRDRAERITREHDQSSMATPAAPAAAAAAAAAPDVEPDPGLDAWQDYVGDLHRREPPGEPPG